MNFILNRNLQRENRSAEFAVGGVFNGQKDGTTTFTVYEADATNLVNILYDLMR